MEQLIEIFQLVKPEIDAGRFVSATDLYGEGIIDSLTIIMLIDEINDAYGVQIGAADFRRRDFMTAESILALIERARGE